MSRALARLGKVQLQIMQILWRDGRATARQITEELAREKPVALSTVQTLLRKLETKGAITHEVQDRTFIFWPLYLQSEVTETATRDLLTRLFNGSVSGLVAHLLKHEPITPAELARLRELVEQTPDS
jgi:BlaI family transcriptional regulator, penicillinase repressor